MRHWGFPMANPIQDMQAKHWAVLGACLVSISSMGSAMHDWSEIASVRFVFGVLGVIGANLGSMYMQRPNE